MAQDTFADAVVDFGPDIEDEAVTQNAWAPDKWLARGLITQAQWDAAKKYRESARAAKKGPYKAATAAVGATLSPVLAWCVVSHGTVTGWAECKGWDERRAAGEFFAALDRLERFYMGQQNGG